MRTVSSVSEEPGTHSIHCDPPLVQPAPSPAQTHSSKQIVFFAHCTLAFSSFALLNDFRDISKGIKLYWVYFTEKKIEAHWEQLFDFGFYGTKESPSYPLDVWSVLLHGNFFHCAFKTKKWLDVKRRRLFKASPLFILRVNLSAKIYIGLDGSRQLTIWQRPCPWYQTGCLISRATEWGGRQGFLWGTNRPIFNSHINSLRVIETHNEPDIWMLVVNPAFFTCTRKSRLKPMPAPADLNSNIRSKSCTKIVVRLPTWNHHVKILLQKDTDGLSEHAIKTPYICKGRKMQTSFSLVLDKKLSH